MEYFYKRCVVKNEIHFDPKYWFNNYEKRNIYVISKE